MPALCAHRPVPRPIDSWSERAVCVTENIPPVYFDTSEPEARAACNACPVVDECLDHLLSFDEQVGWGAGMSENERKRLVRRNSRPAPLPFYQDLPAAG